MTNLFGDESLPEAKPKADAEKRRWEYGFQRWSNEMMLDGTSPMGACGYGTICDYCEDSNKGKPCVRALNVLLRAEHKTIDYEMTDYEEAFMI